jgi:hypothetical protein
MQTNLISGDTLDFTTVTPDYPASAGWSMVYKLIPRTAGTVITLTSSAVGDDHRMQASAAVTAAWAAVSYSWAGYAVKAGERYTVETGVITVTADPGTATTLDSRSHARKTVEALEAWIESRDPAVAKYEIAGRRMEYIPVGDLLKMRQRYKSEVAAEENADRLANGEGFGRKIQFRI